MKRKIVRFLLGIAIILACLTACSDVVPEPTVEQDPTIATAYNYPQITEGGIDMFYDDRIELSLLSTTEEPQILCQNVTSKAVDTGCADPEVLHYDRQNGLLIAVGTGACTLKLADKEYTVTVYPAPISLFLITGHSIGAGQGGVAAQSICCKAGQVYSTHGVLSETLRTKGVGIGCMAAERPAGIDDLTQIGPGVPGEAGGIAWQWANLTGEKVWVLNAAAGGSCLNEWVSDSARHNGAVELFRYAQEILTNEIAAGHYVLKNMAVVYHSAANYGYKKVEYTDESVQRWFASMWDGFKDKLAMDMDGDGAAETVQAIGTVPIWTNNKRVFETDKPATYYMGAASEYKDVFTASAVGRDWLSDADVQKCFPQHKYATHGESLVLPERKSHIFSDGVHYTQVAYNALGIDVAENIYHFLRGNQAISSLQLLLPDGNKVYDNITLSGVGAGITVVPVTDPVCVSDLSFTVSGNIAMTYPLRIVATAPGTGTLTVKQGDVVIKTVIFTIKP